MLAPMLLLLSILSSRTEILSLTKFTIGRFQKKKRVDHVSDPTILILHTVSSMA